MLETYATPLSIRASSRNWMRSVWESLWLGGGDRMKPSPILELAWIDGKPVIMGRNQTMKMLIESPLPAPRKGLFGLRPKPRLPVVRRNANHPSH